MSDTVRLKLMWGNREAWQEQALENQQKRCEGDWHLAPYDGVCSSCKKFIYTSAEHGHDLITCCPWCHRSFCE